jgi:hypothetical protein
VEVEKDHKVLKDQMDPLVQKVILVIPELKVFREIRELKVSRAEVILELRDLKVHRDLKVPRAVRDLLVQMDREEDTCISTKILEQLCQAVLNILYQKAYLGLELSFPTLHTTEKMLEL